MVVGKRVNTPVAAKEARIGGGGGDGEGGGEGRRRRGKEDSGAKRVKESGKRDRRMRGWERVFAEATYS